MINFEIYLNSIGYKPYRLNVLHNGINVLEEFNGELSTMDNLDRRWMKSDEYHSPKTPNGHKGIVCGLHEVGKPPTLIFPRPTGIDSDDKMNQVLQKYSMEEVYNVIFDKSIIL